MNNQVVIVDDHPAIRMAVRSLLKGEGYNIVGEAENGTDALPLINELRPKIVILDIGLPKTDGLTVINRLTALRWPIKVIVLTAHASNHMAIRCMEAGAHGFVNKHDGLCELANVIQTVDAGSQYFPDQAFCFTDREGGKDRDKVLLKTLSISELGVLQHLAQGLSNKQIAERLSLSCKTISTYQTRLLLKLNADTLLNLYGLEKRNGPIET